MNDLRNKFAYYQHRIELAMDSWLPAETMPPNKLHTAMRYATLGGGKRLRPILCYATGEALEIPTEQLDSIACALEFIHSYSLIHDDLPAMDDDDLRRGKPSCHKQFDEATAILAGDALQALAFYILTNDKQLTVDASIKLKLIETLAQACGSRGMAGGQAIDLDSVGLCLDLAQLENMHIHKTGALIRAAIVLPALCARQINELQIQQLDSFGKAIGLAFQIVDDILDETSDTKTLGKTQGMDRLRNKPTYPSLLGLQAAKNHASELYNDALHQLANFDNKAAFLRDIAHYVIQRKR